VKLATPRWWYRRGPRVMPVTRLLLTPLSWIWAAVTARRIARATSIDPGAPVISVGNITVGGVGKTPVARALLQVLHQRGIQAHGLSRGYGGVLAGPVQVDLAAHTEADVGDEALMLAADAPMWVSRDRVAGARAAVQAGAQAVVMDDGHQNPALRKTLSLVVVDGETRDDEWPFGDGAVFPAGPMREPLAAGLARADAVVVLAPADLPTVDPRLLQLFADLPVLIARLQPLQPPPSGPQLGFAGIGKPWKVERSLKAAGCDLVDFAPFPDHGAYSEGDLTALADHAAKYGAGLVTTEKDWVRLPPAWKARVVSWPVGTVFEDPEALATLLAKAGL
jgi:tetraacyldisaccharide 4'-kinase